MHKPAILPPYGDHKQPLVAWSVVAVACVANFLDLFQSSMVLFGLPPIAEDLGFTEFDINWVLVAYTITFATFLLIGGQLADRVGLRTTFLMGTGILSWTNVLCAWTPNQQGLLAGRALAGVGAALTTATGISVISHTFPPGKNQNAGLALYVSCGPIGTVLGVIIGALLTESSQGWRSLFWVTFIFAVFAFSLGFLLIPRFERPANKPGVDFLGLFTFTAGTAMLVYGLNDAENRGWKKPEIIVTIILGALGLIAFPVVESKVSNPAIPTTILKDPHVQLPLTIFMFIGGGWITWFFISTQIALNSLKYDTVLAACYFLPATAAAIIGGGIGNKLVGMGYAKLVIAIGYAISVGALVPWGFVGPQFGIWFVIVFAMIYLFASPPIAVGAQAIVLGQIPTEDHGTASAMMNVMYQFGSSLFLAVVNVVVAATNKGDLLRGYHNGMWTLLGFTATGMIIYMVFYLPMKGTRAGKIINDDHASDNSLTRTEEGKHEASTTSN